MKLVPNQLDIDKWVAFFKSTAKGGKRFKPSTTHRAGLSNMFKARTRYSLPIVPSSKPDLSNKSHEKAPTIVSPAQASVEQAKSELERGPTVSIVDVAHVVTPKPKRTYKKRTQNKKKNTTKTSTKKTQKSKARPKKVF